MNGFLWLGFDKKSVSSPFMNTTTKSYSLSEVRRHNNPDSAWIIVHGHVYNCICSLKDHLAMCEEMKEKLSQHHRQSEHAGVRPFAASDNQQYGKLTIEDDGVGLLLKLLTKSTSLCHISTSLCHISIT